MLLKNLLDYICFQHKINTVPSPNIDISAEWSKEILQKQWMTKQNVYYGHLWRNYLVMSPLMAYHRNVTRVTPRVPIVERELFTLFALSFTPVLSVAQVFSFLCSVL